MKAKNCIPIFDLCIDLYHKTNDIDTDCPNPYNKESIEHIMFLKNWIDTVQWHLEDIIRDPQITPDYGIKLKIRIDSSNQERTNIVEKIDDYYLELYKEVALDENAKLNTESPGWVIDRLSILCLKIYHMQEQVERDDVDKLHIDQCKNKLNVLLEQKNDLCTSLDELLIELESGKKKIKVYRQMKMYNDATLNPVLYKKEID
jgi:hypothetical protein